MSEVLPLSSHALDHTSLDEGIEEVRARILHLLEIYPFMARSMIQVGIGPGCPPKIWDPILQQLVSEGKICKEEINTTSPKGRSGSKDVYHLPCFTYPPAKLESETVPSN